MGGRVCSQNLTTYFCSCPCQSRVVRVQVSQGADDVRRTLMRSTRFHTNINIVTIWAFVIVISDHVNSFALIWNSFHFTFFGIFYSVIFSSVQTFLSQLRNHFAHLETFSITSRQHWNLGNEISERS